MLPAQKNKLTMSILGRLKQQGPPPAGNMRPFNPLDGTDQTSSSPEDDLGRSGVEAPGSQQNPQDQVAADDSQNLNDMQFSPLAKKKRPIIR